MARLLETNTAPHEDTTCTDTKLNVVNKDQFYAKVIFPVINNAYEKHQQEVIETVKK